MSSYPWREHVRAYLGEHFSYFALVALLFGMGIVFGALTVNHLAAAERQNLLTYLSSFLRDFNHTASLPGAVLARETIKTSFKTLAFLFVLGVTAIGTPLILLVVFTRGFVLGFTVGFLVKQLMVRGFLFALAAVVPHNLLLVPALLVAAVANIDFGVVLIQSRLSHRPAFLSRELLRCLGITSVAFLILALAGLIEGYLSPVLVRWMAEHLV